MISATAPRTVSARIRHLYLAIAFGLVIGMIPIGFGVDRAVAATSDFAQGVNGYSGAVDTWLAEIFPDQDNGADTQLEIDASDLTQALIRFEGIVGDSAGQIPAGSTVTSASLTLTNRANPTVATATLSAHRMLTTWTGSSTWNMLGSGVQTDDVEAAAAAEASVTGSVLTVSDGVVTLSGLEDSVQAWVDGATNNGWLLLLDNTDGWDGHSSEAGTTSDRPVLSVTYTAPAPNIVIVNSTGDSSDANPSDGTCETATATECTLRAAIEEANASATIDTIQFAVPETDGGHASGLWTIAPSTALPSISSSVTLDARTQTGWTADPVVVLDGSSTTSATGVTLSGASDGSVVAGLRIIGFDLDGVFVASGADGITIIDNWIGSDGTGSSIPGNGDDGVDLNGINAVIDGNVVNHNTDEGIDVRASGATITGNIIGLEADGSSGTGNGDVGIAVFSDNTTIGGSSAADRNVISANFEGIEINSSNNTVQGNYVGVDATGSVARGNDSDDGVEIQSGTGNLIGGTAAGEGNTIANNQQDGVRLAGGNANAVLGNTIYGNGGLGIDLGTNGVTANDSGDPDTGANDLLNYPVITSAVASGGNVTVTFDLDVPAGTYRVEFFDNSAADGSGYGEGESFLGSVDVSAGNGLTHVVLGAPGDIITATATESLGGGSYGPTSEFSAAHTAVLVATSTARSDPEGGTASDRYSTATTSLGPVSYWRLGESSGTSAVDEMGSNNGAYVGATLGAAGALAGDPDTAADFDGTNDYVDVGSFDLAGSGVTLTGWINADTFAVTDGRIISKAANTQEADHTWMLSTVSDSGEIRLRARVKAGGTTDTLHANSGALQTGQWHFAVLTYDESQIKLFLDGVEVGSAAHSVGGAADSEPLVPVWIGANSPDATVKPFDGRIDEVAVFDRALTVAEIRTLHAAGRQYYSIAEGSSLSTSVLDGVLVNDTDPNEDTLTASIVSGPSNAASFTLNTDGSFDYTPSPSFSGTDSFTYSACDVGSNCDSAIATITVDPVGPFTVNSTGDAPDQTPGDGLCDTGNNNADGNPECTFRAALEEANAFSGAHAIDFAMPTGEAGHAAGVWTLQPASPLPSITEQVTIDGTSQSGWAANTASAPSGLTGGPVVQIDGTGAGASVNGITFGAGADNSVLRGLVVNRFAGNGVQISATGVTVAGSYIGTDPAGTLDLGNGVDGVNISANGATVGGTDPGDRNLISGNGDEGVDVDSGFSGSLVIGNLIGTTKSGLSALGNGTSGWAGGVLFDGSNNRLGGTAAGEANVISGNAPYGVMLHLSGGSNIVQGNYIGLGSDGSTVLSNGTGINIASGSAGNTIGGSTTAARNLISGNTADGIYLQDAGTDGNIIQGNYIGTDVTGLLARGNGDRGIQIESGANNTIVGGTVAGEGNVISANGNDGIIISDGASPGAGTTGTVVEGNLVGVGADGTTALGNGTNGVRVTTEDGHRIGGTAAGAGNTIAYNGGMGVDLQNASANANPILGNSIYSNTNIGIDLGDDGVTTNDSGDGDTGANGLLNYPVITSASESGGTVTVTFDLDVPAGNYRVEFFTNPSGADGSGYGEGENFVTSVVVTAGTGLTHTFSGAEGDVITATATHDLGGGTYGDTSEFSAAGTVVGVTPVANDDSATTNEDTAVAIDVVTNDTDPNGDPLLVGSFTQGSNGTVSDNGDGTVTYTPDANFNGSDSFTYTATDGTNTSNTATVTVTITAVNDVPIANDDSATTNEDTSVVIDLVANDTDDDGDTLTVGAFTQGTNGSVVDNGNGTVTYTPNAEYSGSDTFTYTATDGTATSNTATVTVSITAVNDAPVAVDDSASTPEDTAVAIDLVANDTDVEGDPISIDSVGTASNGSVVDNGDGTVTYTPNANFNGTDSFTYTATDGTNTSNTATVTVTVTAVNDAPVANDDSATTNEDTAVVIDLLANDTDVEGDTLSLVSVSNGANGTVVDNGDGTVTYTPDPDWFGTDSFVYSITDGTDNSNIATVTVTVNPVNDDPPVAVDDSATTAEETAVVIDLVANDTDPDGDSLLVGSIVQPTNGTVVDNGDGTVTYTPNADYNGTESFSYTATDGTNSSNIATVWVTVTPVNDAPVAVDDSVSTAEDTAVVVSVLSNDTDADGDTLAVDSFTQPTNGTVTDNGDGTLTYTPDAQYSGSDSFTYVANDGTTTSNTATVSVTVTAVNDVPVAADDTVSTPEDTAVVASVLANDSDPEGDPLSIDSFTQPTNGTVTDNGDGTLTYTPNADYFGSDSFTYVASDVTDTSNTATVTVTVTSVNDAPVAVDDSAATNEDTAVVIDLLANDTDTEGDALSIQGIGQPTNGTVVDNGDGTVTYTPDADYTGADPFTYSITDGTDPSNVATVSVTVNPVNDAPVAVTDTVSTSEDAAVVVGVLANDADTEGDALSIDSFTQGTNGTVTDNGDGTLTYTPDADFNGTDSFTYVATDGTLTSNPATVTVTVTAVNDAPIAVDDSATTDEDTAMIVSVLTNDTDSDGDALSVDSFTQPVNGTVVDNGDGTLTYTPDADFNGTNTFTYVATDGSSTSNTATVTVTVTAVNDAPVASDDSATTNEDTAVVIDLFSNDSDPDGDPLSMDTLGSATSGTVVDNGDGTVTFTPDADFNGTDSFTYSVTDGTLSSNTATVIVTVTSVNDAPVAVDDSAITNEDTAVVIDLLANDTDTEGDALSIQGIGQPTNGSVVDNGDGTVTYTPDADYTGADPFTYSITDGTDPSNVATVSVTVNPVNDPPVAVGDPVSTPEDTALVVSVLANDTDAEGDPLSVDSFTQPVNGTVTDNGDGTLTYTPDADFNGTDSFTYVATDGTLTSNTATVTVTVSPVNDVPVANDDSAFTSEDTAVTIDLVANDTDIDGDTLSFAGLSNGANGAVTDNGDGTVTYTPNADFNGTDTFTYSLNDGTTNSNAATVTVTVNPANDAPVAVDDSASAPEDTAVTVDLVANDTDVDGDPINIDTLGAAANGSVVDNGDGTVTYTPNADFNGTDGFTYTATDGTATSNTATVTVTVTAVNDAPVANHDIATTDEDSAVTIDLFTNDTDTEGDALSMVSVSNGGNGSVVDNGDGTVTYTPNADFNGTDSFGYSVTDGTDTSNIATVTVTVNPINDVPTAVDDTSTTNEDVAVVIDVTANDTDPDGDTLLVDTLGTASNGTVADKGDGTVTYTPDADFNGTDSFTYSSTDGTLTSNTATVTVTVTAVNDAPVAVDDASSTAEDVAVVIDVTANDTDTDGDALSIDTLGAATNGTLVDNGDGTVTYTPDADLNGTDSFTYTVTDGTISSNTATITVTVNSVADAPVANPDTASTAEDTAVVIDVAGNDTDVDGDLDPTTTSVTAAPTNGTAAPGPFPGSLTFTPDADFNGTDSFTYQICDATALCDTAVVSITVTATNDAPVAVDDSVSTLEDTAVVISVLDNDTDVDLDALSVASVGTATNGTVVDNGNGTVTYTPDADYSGLDSFSYTATDGTLTSNTATVSVTVGVVNDAPVAGDDTATTDEDTSVVIPVTGNDTDVEADPLSVASVGAATSGTVVDNGDGTVTYTPDADFNGADSFTYTITDGVDTSNVATVSVTVNAVNDAPVAVDDTGVTAEDTAVTIDLLANDSDTEGDVLSIASLGASGNGTVVDNGDGTVTYTPDADFNGADSFTYTITDGVDTSNVATVSVTVNAVNDAPVAVDDTGVIAEDTAVTIDLLANDSDTEGDVLSIASLGASGNGTVVDNGDGTVTYTPDADFNGADSFTYTFTDGVDTSNTATVSVTVDAVNDVPVATDDAAVTDEDTGVTVAILTNDTDADGDPLAVDMLSPAGNGSLSDNGDGTVTYTPNADFNGVDSFSYTVSDGTDTSNIATVNITVNPTNDGPVAIDDSSATSSDRAVVIDVLANDIDPDGDALAVVGVSAPVGGTVTDNGDGTVTFNPSLSFSGAGSFSYTVSDGALTDTAVVTISVTLSNSAPAVVDFRTSIPETTQSGDVIGVVSATDPEDNGMVFSVSGDARLRIDGSGALTLVGTVTAGDLLLGTVTVTDADGASAQASIAVTVTAVNFAPEISDQTFGIDSDAQIGAGVGSVVASDPDGDDLTYWLVGDAPFVIDANGRISVAGDLGPLAGSDISFSVLVTDTDGLSAGATITIAVRAVTPTNTTEAPPPTTSTTVGENQAPVATDDLFIGSEDSEISFDPLANDLDPDGDSLTLTWLSVPDEGEIRNGVMFVPRADWNGTASAVYRIEDGRGGSSTATVTFVVNPVNDAPRIQSTSDVSTVSSGGSIEIPIPKIIDPESDSYTISIGDPAHGTAEIVGGSIIYKPDPGYEGQDTIKLFVVDTAGAGAEGVIIIEVVIDGATVAVKILSLADGGEGGFGSSGGPGGLNGTGGGESDQFVLLGIPFFGLVASEVLSATWAVRAPLIAFVVVAAVTLLATTRRSFSLAVKPLPVARPSNLTWSIVLVGEYELLPALAGPGHSHKAISWFDPGVTGIESTGNLMMTNGTLWVEVVTSGGRAWVEAKHVTPGRPETTAVTRDAMIATRDELVRRIRTGEPFAELVSGRGLYMQVAGEIESVPHSKADPLLRHVLHAGDPESRQLLDALSMPVVKDTSLEVPVDLRNFEYLVVGEGWHRWALYFERGTDDRPLLVGVSPARTLVTA